MSESKLFLSVDKQLLDEAKTDVTLTFLDGEKVGQELTLSIPASIDFRNPYNYDLLQFLPNTEIFNINKFFKLTEELIGNALLRSNLKQITLTEEYPPDNFQDFGNEVISYKLISRQPGAVDQSNSVRPQRFRPYYTLKSKSGDMIEIHRRSLDHEIEFTCWATSNKVANERALWFEKLMIANSWVFKSKGADRFNFQKRLMDGYITTGQQKIVYRPLRFFLRYDEFISVNRYEIKNINIITSLTSEIE